MAFVGPYAGGFFYADEQDIRATAAKKRLTV